MIDVSDIQTFKTYVADTPVNVHYCTVTYNKLFRKIIIKTIIVTPDNRPLYKTRTKELDEAIIGLIEENRETKCTTSASLTQSLM